VRATEEEEEEALRESPLPLSPVALPFRHPPNPIMAAAKRTWVYNKKFGNTTLSALA
jgi:hypothetical protein